MFCFQMTTKDEVRKLYAVYFWFWKLGDTLSVVFCLGITFVPDDPTKKDPESLITDFEAKFAMMSRGFAIFVDVCATTSMVILIIGETILLTLKAALHPSKHHILLSP